MGAMAFEDVRSMRVPNVWNALAAIGGFVAVTIEAWRLGFDLLERARMGSAVSPIICGGVFFLLRELFFRLRGVEGLGFGDVKLAATGGVWLGWEIFPVAVSVAALGAIALGRRRGCAQAVMAARAKNPVRRLPRARDLDRLGLFEGEGSSRQRGLTKRDEPLLSLVPQHESDATETLQEGQPPDVFQLGTIAQYLRQTIIGNSAREMMDVMDADIRGEPSEHARQIVVGAAVQRRLVHVPFLVRVPDCLLELMLDIEQPDADRGGQQRHGEMQKQERSDAEQPDRAGRENCDRRVRAPSC